MTENFFVGLIIYHSVATVPVFSNMRLTTQGSLPTGAALKLKSKMALVYTGGLLWWLKQRDKQTKNIVCIN